MKLLIVTQTVDAEDPILGFFVRWILEFSKHCEKVHVLALNIGEYELPDNVTVYCLGKSEGKSKFVWLWRLWSLSFKLRHNYNSVFVHMNPEYVLHGGLLWHLFRKKIGLWYTHGSVSHQLRFAEKFVHTIFTASSESCRLNSPKILVTGHGVDTDFFSPGLRKYKEDNILQLVTVGRIAPIKDQMFLLIVVKNLVNEEQNVVLTIVGDALSDSDRAYKKCLSNYVKQNNLQDHVRFAGSKNQLETRDLLRMSDVFVHASKTGSLDKVLLEALAVGLKVVSTADLKIPQVFFTETTEGFISEVLHKPPSEIRARSKHSLYTLIPSIMRKL